MTSRDSARATPIPERRYRSPDVPAAVIRRYAKRIAEAFRPEKIILFGSYAYGTPRKDSDVDLLVVMPASDPVSQAVRIRLALPAPFPMDLLVRSTETLLRALEDDDWFLREIVEKGMVLYEAPNGAVGKKGRIRSRRRTTARRREAVSSCHAIISQIGPAPSTPTSF